jgi:DNA-binding response OmpR family regulator
MPSKVLIVDDDKTTREGLAEFLEEAGYEAVAVGTFEDATRILRTSPPDLLIADVRLGPFNGLQLVISSPQPIPAIIITGFADPVLEADARRRGAEYVLKPVSPARLLDLVAQKLMAARPGFGTPRRWERKPVIGGLAINVGDTPARIVDVSYGGLRFEMQRSQAASAASPLSESLSITLPTAQLSVKAKLVWENLIGEGTWMCGAALFQETPEWHGLVDAI